MILLIIEAAKKNPFLLIQFKLPKQIIPTNNKHMPINMIFFFPQKD